MGARFTPGDVAAAQAAYMREVQRAQKSAATATPQMAKNMVSDAKQYPWLSPTVVATLNQANASQATRDMAAYAAAVGGMKQGQTFIDPSAPVPEPKKKKAWYEKLGPVSWVGKKIGDVGAWTGDHLPNAVRAPVKGASRFATAALQAPYQVLQNRIGENVIDPLADTIGDVAHGRFSELPGDVLRQAKTSVQTLGNPLGMKMRMPTRNADGNWSTPDMEATDMAQMVQHTSKSGSGFFAGEAIQDLTAERAQRVRGTDAGGHAWTLGRFVAAPLPQDSAVHKIVSGTTDVASALWLDPMNWIGAGEASKAPGLAGKAFGGPVAGRIAAAGRAAEAEKIAATGKLLQQAKQASKFAGEFRAIGEDAGAAGALAHATESMSHATAWADRAKSLVDEAETMSGVADTIAKVGKKNPEWVDTVRNAAGLVSGPKGESAVTGRHFQWLLSKEGQGVVEALRVTDSPTVVRAMYGGKISTKAAVDIAKAQTSEDVVRALGGALAENGLRGPNLRKSAAAVGRRSWIEDHSPTLARAMGWKPNGTWVDFADADGALDTIFDTLGNVKITGEDRRVLTDRWAEALATGDRASMYQLGKETNGRIAKQLIDAGMSKADAADITTAFFKDSERMRAYASFDLAAQVPGTFLDGKKGGNGITRVSQILDGGWGLMDPEAVNRVRIQTSRTVRLLGEEGSRRRLPLTAVGWFQDNVFKPAAVLRPALMGRLLPDEAMRVLFGGHIGDSGGFLMGLANHPKTSALGEMFDAPGELLKVDKQINKLTKGGERIGDRAVEALKAGDTGSLVASHPLHTDAIKEIGVEHGKLTALEAKVTRGDSLTREEAQLVEDLADFHGGDSALDALHERLGALEGRLARRITDHPELGDLYERRAVLERQFSRKQSGIVEVLTGSRGNGTIAKVLDGKGLNDSVLYKSGSRIIINKNDQRFVEMYRNGLADELISMSSDPVYRRIANGGLLRGDVVHTDPGATSGLVDQFTRRRGEYTDRLKDITGRREAAEQAVADLRTQHEADLADLIARRDSIMEARDTGRKAIAERQARVDDLNAQIAELIDGDAQKGAITAARRELRDAQKDLRWTKRIEAGELPDMGIADFKAELAKVRNDIGELRKGHRAALRKAEGAAAVIEREQGIAERGMAKIEAAFKKGLLDVDGTTHVGDVPTTLDDVKRWLMNGNGREHLEAFARASGNQVTDKFVSDWVDLMAKDVELHWGNNAAARRAIVDGQINGEAIAESSRQWGPRRAPGEKLRAWVDEYAASPEAPSQVRYEPSIEEVRRHRVPGAMKINEQRRRVVDRMFATFYGNASDRFIRIPEYSNGYWRNMEELIPKLEPDEAARILETLDDANLPARQAERIRTLAGGAHGEGLLEDADKLAHGYALDDVKKLLFDMDRTNQFQDMTRLLAPFGRAWWEVISTWGKIALGEPAAAGGVAARLGQAAETVKNVANIDHSFDKGLRAARGAGAFYTDENGQEVFNYPLSGQLASVFAHTFAPGSEAAVKTMFRGKVAGLSIGTQLLPGIGPVVALPTYAITQALPVPSAMVDALFPFGKPESLAGAAMPSWMEKLTSGFNADEHEQIYGNTLFEVARGLANSGQYGFDRDGQERLMRDAKRQAQGLTMLRGVVQAFGPSAPIPTYLASTKDGDVTTVKLAQEYQKLINDPEEVAALGAKTPSEAFLAKFGPQVVYYLWGKTKTVSGGETASDEFGRWQESNKDLAGKYPLVFGYFGPQTPGYSPTVAQRQIEMGTRVKRSANDVLALANAKIADMIYYGIKDDMTAKNRAVGVANLNEEQRAWLKGRRDELEQAFPGWDVEARSADSLQRREKQIDQLRSAATDPKVVQTPTGRNLRQYMIWRGQVQDEATRRGVTGWGQANATQDLRDWLGRKALTLAGNDPGFASLFDDVLSREMKD